jgi:hypothetical protein
MPSNFKILLMGDWREKIEEKKSQKRHFFVLRSGLILAEIPKQVKIFFKGPF